MNHHTAKCISCNTICHFPSLKARTVSCDACARKRSAALNEARIQRPEPERTWRIADAGWHWDERQRDTRWLQDDNGKRILVSQRELDDACAAGHGDANYGVFLLSGMVATTVGEKLVKVESAIRRQPLVDKWEQRARELTEEKRADCEVVQTISHVDVDRATDEVYVSFMSEPPTTIKNTIRTTGQFVRRLFGSPFDMSRLIGGKVRYRGATAEVIGLSAGPRPAKRPFAVGDRVVVKRVPFGLYNGYEPPSSQLARVVHIYADDELPMYVEMDEDGVFAGYGGRYRAGDRFVVGMSDLEHA